MALNLTSRADYKAYKGINSTNQDAAIDAILPKVSALVKRYCNQSFVDNWEIPKVEYFDGGLYSFPLSEGPLVGMPVVEMSDDRGTTWTTLVLGTDYIVRQDPFPQIYSLASDRMFLYKFNGYRVTYTCGYEDVPDDLELAVFDLITYYLRNEPAVHGAKTPGSSTAQVEYITTSNMPAHIKRVLDLHKASFL